MATKASGFTNQFLLRPWSGRALVRVRAGLGLFVCCCRALALLGCSGGAGVPPLCCCLVRGLCWVLGKGRTVGHLLAQGLSLSLSTSEVSVSTVWLRRCLRKTGPTVSRASLHSAITKQTICLA